MATPADEPTGRAVYRFRSERPSDFADQTAEANSCREIVDDFGIHSAMGGSGLPG